MSKATNANPILLRRGLSIGTGNAESDDDFLFDCFIDYPPVEACRRLGSPGMIVSGRTGAGKTAILRHIESSAEHAAFLDPFEMSMGYVSNSDALRFLTAIGADLDLLFQVLWKHVLCIEFIRLRWNVESTQRSNSVFARLRERFGRDERKNRSLAYLQEWQGKFWITMDQNIKEITESVEKKLQAEVGAEIDKFKLGGQYERRLSSEKKSEIVARTRKIISTDQLSELHGVIDMLSIPENGDHMKGFYILIDKLDERWVDDSVRFRMIKALIESLKSFRKIQNLKILVALRTDVLERVVQETADIAFQREKFEDNAVRLDWSKSDLKALVETRVAALFRRKYTGKTVTFGNIFPSKVGSQDTFDWMLERTLMRPRDLIAFVNACFDEADGQPQVTVSAIRKAEGEYSRKRKDALAQEWISSFPTIHQTLEFLAKRRRVAFTLSEVGDDEIENFALAICSQPKAEFDRLWEVCNDHVEKSGSGFDVLAQIASTLYRVGAVGIKIRPEEKMAYSHMNQPLIEPSILTSSSALRIVPMLLAGYHLQGQANKA